MTEETVWDDSTREELRETLRTLILGEIRLRYRDHDDILQSCREIYIDDDCPADEREAFIQFATEELSRAAAKHAVEQAHWPRETDCDRLDRVEATLRDRGILLWQVSPCCDTCTGAELPGRVDDIESRHPGFRDRLRGYAFYIDQNLPEMLSEGTEVSVYLAYGWVPPEDEEVPPEVYEANSLDIAREVCGCLREHGIEPDWDGDFSHKISVSINWQRREMLT